jgi:surface antigen
MSFRFHFAALMITACFTGVLLASHPAPAGGLVNPFDRSAVKLDEADWDLLKESVRTVLEKQEIGATADWASATSGKAGRATLLKTFTRDGMVCGLVEHEFTKGDGQSYQLPFCKTADGRWKVAF